MRHCGAPGPSLTAAPTISWLVCCAWIQGAWQAAPRQVVSMEGRALLGNDLQPHGAFFLTLGVGKGVLEGQEPLISHHAAAISCIRPCVKWIVFDSTCALMGWKCPPGSTYGAQLTFSGCWETLRGLHLRWTQAKTESKDWWMVCVGKNEIFYLQARGRAICPVRAATLDRVGAPDFARHLLDLLGAPFMPYARDGRPLAGSRACLRLQTPP